MKYVVYDSVGMIMKTGQCQEGFMLRQCAEGQYAVEGEADELTQYVDGGVVLDRPVMAVTHDEADHRILRNLPYPCEVVIDGHAYECNEGTATLDLPIGSYQVKVVKWPYMDYECEVSV